MSRATLSMRDDQAEATIRLEHAAARDVAGTLEREMNAARSEVTQAYLAAFGDLNAPARPGPELAALVASVQSTLLTALDGGDTAATSILNRYMKSAAQLGAEHAAEVIETASPLDGPDAAAAPAVSHAEDAKPKVRTLTTQAAVAAGGFATVLAAVGVGNQAVARQKAVARAVVNESHNRAVDEVASANGYGRVWVAEEDGCVECLAYAGQVAWVGEDFPGGLTMDTRPPRNTEDLPDPPLHYNCRCQVMPYHEDDGPAFPEALKREARRSVAKGWRVESESEAVRLRAAESLLARGPRLPRTVVEGAERSLSRGKFPDRRVPKYPAP